MERVRFETMTEGAIQEIFHKEKFKDLLKPATLITYIRASGRKENHMERVNRSGKKIKRRQPNI